MLSPFIQEAGSDTLFSVPTLEWPGYPTREWYCVLPVLIRVFVLDRQYEYVLGRQAAMHFQVLALLYDTATQLRSANVPA